jgi:DNA-directed RNA polymerase subunit H (RpoH/RPB5)
MGSITLNIALVLFFNYLYHQVKPEKNMLSSEEISKVIENLK